ncbi:MAG: hypothetical protein ACP5VE_04725 [Chthonomonadales bacterium]
MTDEFVFDFEGEFSLLDIGATSSLLKTGSVRPTVLAYTQNMGVEAVSLRWNDDTTVAEALEQARRYLRELQPLAYGIIAHISRQKGALIYHQPEVSAPPGSNDFLAIALFARGGIARAVTYPIRRNLDRIALGMPSVTDADTTDWMPLGDLWNNPFCAGDLVRFRLHDRPVDPSSPLWQKVVDLTRLRIQEDQPNADDYMAFLDDLRNGIFRVAGRSDGHPNRVLLRPRTVFNPLGTLTVEASRLTLMEASPAAEDRVAAP